MHCPVVHRTNYALQIERQRNEGVTQRLVVAGNMLSKTLYNLQPASPQLPKYISLTILFMIPHNHVTKFSSANVHQACQSKLA